VCGNFVFGQKEIILQILAMLAHTLTDHSNGFDMAQKINSRFFKCSMMRIGY